MDDFIIENGTLTKYVGTETSVVVPEGVTIIGPECFPSNITSVTLPHSLKKICKYAFGVYNSQLDIHIKNIDEWCNVELVNLGIIKKGNLYLNDELVTHLIVPDGISFLSSQHVAYDSVAEITIPKSIKKIVVDTSFRCQKIHLQDLSAWCNTELIIHTEFIFKYIWELYLNGEHITHLEIPQGNTVIKKGTFFGCQLESVTIPEGVVKIEEAAFQCCKYLKKVHLPSTIRAIKDYAFGSAFDMTEFTLLSDSGVFISPTAFKNCDAMPKIWPNSHKDHHSFYTICAPEDATLILRSNDDPIYLHLEYYNKADYDRICKEADDWCLVGTTTRFGHDGYTDAGFDEKNDARWSIFDFSYVIDNFSFVGMLKYKYFQLVSQEAIDVIFIKDWNGTPILFSEENYTFEDGLWETGRGHSLYFVKKES